MKRNAGIENAQVRDYLPHRVSGVRGVTLYEDTAMPTMVQVGDTVELACNFILDGARRGESSLYSVKWYRDNVEFFRYVMIIERIPHQSQYIADTFRARIPTQQCSLSQVLL